ncbi:hypothetical protein IEQ44_06120 [Nocardioides sp. Y6]|uniref:Uncharacterized protein n=1 Tax=Nocardioides malaquae TaxID=2773426 RepID=A0ABR9RRM4_9ACTN|nr:hypothetical protein [Nocardioides malaquae]MBE7324222.1 hypothetical protein [Nocardioides malaquae]
MRRQRIRLQRPGRWGLAIALVLAGGVVTGTQLLPAHAAPERVLQGVEVGVGSDGRVRTIVSRAVRQSSDEVVDDVEELDAAEHASDLPVRVQTQWRLDGRSGTDLADIEGESGRVVVEVSVQNTTVRPRQVRYDSDGVSKRRWALVGAPLTVMGSADLGKDSFGSVVMKDDQNPAAVTNGVLDRGDESNARVQWASMLAPPRLAASMTMRLVIDTDDFEVPTFDLSVQPGLVTDPSVQRLLEVAFSDEAGSTVALETRTIELIGSVNGVLSEASAVLGQIQGELGGAADQLGARTIANLQSSSREVSTSMAGLSADLDALSTSIGDQLESGNSTALTNLKRNVDRVKDLLGDPDTEPAPPRNVAGCSLTPAPAKKKVSVMEQLATVSSQLDSLALATANCRTMVTEELTRAVGVVAEDGTCTPAGSASCLILGVGAQFSDHLATLSAFRDDFAARFDETLVGDVATTTTALRDSVAEIDRRAQRLGRGGTDEIDQVIQEVVDLLRDANATLAPEGGVGPEERLDTLTAELRAAADQLDSVLGRRGLVPLTADQQLRAIRQLACNPGPLTPVNPQADEISRLAVGVGCEEEVPAEGYPEASLGGRLVDLVTVRDELRAHAATTQAVSDSVAQLTGSVEDALSTAEGLLDAESPELSQRVLALVCGVRSLSVPEAELTGPCAGGTATTAPMPQLLGAVDELEENQVGLTDEEISAAFAGAVAVLETSSTDAATGAGEVSRAGQDASTRVGGLVAELQQEIEGTGDEILRDGRRVVKQQRRGMDRTVQQVERQLSAGVSRAVRAINGDVSSSNRNIKASERRLLADLRKVLVDLGERRNNGSGLLGSLVTGATSTGVSNEQIRSASDTAASFSRVRAEGLEALLMEQEQTALALRLQDELPVFGIDVPEGSVHTTVYSFRVGA